MRPPIAVSAPEAAARPATSLVSMSGRTSTTESPAAANRLALSVSKATRPTATARPAPTPRAVGVGSGGGKARYDEMVEDLQRAEALQGLFSLCDEALDARSRPRSWRAARLARLAASACSILSAVLDRELNVLHVLEIALEGLEMPRSSSQATFRRGVSQLSVGQLAGRGPTPHPPLAPRTERRSPETVPPSMGRGEGDAGGRFGSPIAEHHGLNHDGAALQIRVALKAAKVSRSDPLSKERYTWCAELASCSIGIASKRHRRGRRDEVLIEREEVLQLLAHPRSRSLAGRGLFHQLRALLSEGGLVKSEHGSRHRPR